MEGVGQRHAPSGTSPTPGCKPNAHTQRSGGTTPLAQASASGDTETPNIPSRTLTQRAIQKLFALIQQTFPSQPHGFTTYNSNPPTLRIRRKKRTATEKQKPTLGPRTEVRGLGWELGQAIDMHPPHRSVGRRGGSFSSTTGGRTWPFPMPKIAPRPDPTGPFAPTQDASMTLDLPIGRLPAPPNGWTLRCGHQMGAAEIVLAARAAFSRCMRGDTGALHQPNPSLQEAQKHLDNATFVCWIPPRILFCSKTKPF
jgi:hypothetical protein